VTPERARSIAQRGFEEQISGMTIRTKRWCDPAEQEDGTRLLMCRFRPRGLRKGSETWDEWDPELGPSRELLAAFHGKKGSPISWSEYRRRYLAEMRGQKARIRALAERIDAGETVTLLCSSACVDPKHCHRTVLAELIRATSTKVGTRATSGYARRAPARTRRTARPTKRAPIHT
jgi:uncharacterized protein YeaO (DUF488 family)